MTDINKKKKFYYYSVIPLIKTIFGKNAFFTYCSEKKISLGSLIEIYFGKKIILGVVIESVSKPHFSTKPIKKILSSRLITPSQLFLAQKISTFYKYCLGKCLKLFIPPLVKKEKSNKQIPSEIIKFLAPKSIFKNIPLLNLEELKIIQTLLLTNQFKTKYSYQSNSFPVSACIENTIFLKQKFCSKKGNHFLLKGLFWKRKAFIFELVKQTLRKTDFQGLILLPDLASSQRIFAEIISSVNKKYWPQIVFLNSETSPAAFWSSFQKIKTKKIRIVIATRRGLFLPFKKLGWIFVENEHTSTFNQTDQSPTFHVNKVSEMLADIFGAKVIFSSFTPSLESFLLSEKKYSPYLFSFRKPLKKIILENKNQSSDGKKDSLEIINSAKYFFSTKDYLIISQEVKKAILDSYRQKKSVFIFVRQRGQGRRVICKNCRKTFLCSSCKTPLVAIKDGYQCPSCKKKESLFVKCPWCQSFQLKTVGFGQEKVQEIIKNIFPDFSIIKAEAANIKNISQISKLFQPFLVQKNPSIIIGGISALHLLENHPFGALIILDGDDFFRIGFEADLEKLADFFEIYEKTFWPITQNRSLKIIFQTFNPQSKDWSWIKKFQWEKILHQEAKLRKKLFYPPFSFIIRLTKRNKNPRSLEKNYQKIYNDLLKKNEKRGYLKVYISERGLIKSVQLAKSKRFEAIFFLKITSLNFFKSQEQQKIITQIAQNEWKVDFHPRLLE